MKASIPFRVLTLAGVCIGVSSCVTENAGSGKDRGVYTAVVAEGQHLDLPASGYTACKSFGPGQEPVAIVVGYGVWQGTFNTPQAFELELVELATGSVIFSQAGNSYADKAAMFKLPIRKSGSYQLKLLIDGKADDTWNFTVNREEASGTNIIQTQAYAKGVFGVSIEGADEKFNQADDRLIGAILNSIQKQQTRFPGEIFAQVAPGQVQVRCQLTEDGQINSAEMVHNTLTQPLADFFLEALKRGAPYTAAKGGGGRVIQFTFRYD